jgi:preprotein translocase subunit Sec61beta
MADEINMPGSFGGLMRYKEEYDSKLKMSPSTVVLLIIIVVLFVIGLNLFSPIKAAVSSILGLLI